MDLKGNNITLPTTSWVSIFTETELDEIQANHPYQIKVFGRVLEVIMEIPKINGATGTTSSIEEPPQYTPQNN